MTEKEPDEIKRVREHQKNVLGKISFVFGILILFVWFISIIIKRTSITNLRIKCIETTDSKTSINKNDSILITKQMINVALNNAPVGKNSFAQGYIPYLTGDNYPLFTTNYSIRKPLFLSNFFSNGDIGFVRVGNKSDSATINIYRHAFDYMSLGKESLKISLSQIHSTGQFDIKYFPDQFIVINEIDSIKLFSVKESNKMIDDYIEKNK